jgi:hypothetical protein
MCTGPEPLMGWKEAGLLTQRLIPTNTRLVTNSLTLSRLSSSLGAISRPSFQRGQP